MLLDADMETVDQAKARLQYACYDVERVSTLDGRLKGTRDDHQLNVGPPRHTCRRSGVPRAGRCTSERRMSAPNG